MVADAAPIARLFGLPYFPITPFWPWLGMLGLIPLPSKWRIQLIYDNLRLRRGIFV